MEGPKLVTSCCFLLLRYSSKPLLDLFQVTGGFFDSDYWLESVVGSSGNLLKVVMWLATT